MSRSQYLHLHCNTTNIPRFYGLVKLHKTGHPIRPIVSFCGSPTDAVSKFLSKILNPLTDLAPQKIKNTVAIKNELDNFRISDVDVLISFDVKSLFTQVPPDLALSSLDDALSNSDQWKERTTLDKKDLLELTNICLSSTVFKYDEKIYKQIHGTPMGSSISGTLAEITMQSIEKDIFDNSPCQIKLWRRYVDDIIAVVPKDSYLVLFNYINSINNSIQF